MRSPPLPSLDLFSFPSPPASRLGDVKSEAGRTKVKTERAAVLSVPACHSLTFGDASLKAQ